MNNIEIEVETETTHRVTYTEDEFEQLKTHLGIETEEELAEETAKNLESRLANEFDHRELEDISSEGEVIDDGE